MPPLQQIRNFNLKVIFLVHFIFIALASMGYWSSSSYLFYNFILILLIIWCIYVPQNEEPVQLAIVVNGVSIILDILLLIMCYPANNSARERFSAAICVLHLVTRPFSIILLVKNLEERLGAPGTFTDLFTSESRQQQSNYEDIDRNPVGSTSGYNFANAQQI